MEKNVAVGRRKASVARAFISKGKGEITINGKDYKDYFSVDFLQNKVVEPMKFTETLGQFDFKLFFLVAIKGITRQLLAPLWLSN